ncbi:MAG: 50S ribosomal protein L21 [Planctomycetes bacterium]|nr:50S ribosomal protein L21 [Planctomycetota bacterium]
MYAVISDRGRQYKAVAGARLTIDRSAAEVGTSIDLPVLLIADDAGVKVGAPFVAGAKAVIKVLSHIRGTKGIVGKYKRRKHQRRRHGFRAEQSVVEVVSISA